MFQHEQAFLQALQGEPTALQAVNASPEFLARLAIYKTSITSTLQQALYKNFKPLENLIGQAAFQELCYHYAAKNLSTALDLSCYGADLHEFIATGPFAPEFPYLADFIEFCGLWRKIYLQRDSEAILLESPYPLYDIWQRCQPEFTGSLEITNWQGPFHYVLYRENARVMVQVISIGKDTISP